MNSGLVSAGILPALAAGLLLTAGSGAAREWGSAELFKLAVDAPKSAFSGKKLVSTWYGDKSQAAEIRVYFRPPASWRHEVLNSAGRVVKTTIQTADSEWILKEGYGTILKRNIRGIRSGGLGPGEFSELLRENYEFRPLGSKPILDRAAQGVSLLPRAKAGPRRLLWVDPATGIVLHRRHSNHNGKLVRESRMVVLDMKTPVSESLFALDPADERRVILEDEREPLRSSGDFQKRGFDAGLWRETLPFGFKLDSARVVLAGGHSVLHLRYSNGLSMLSLFVSPSRIDSSDVSGGASDEDDDDFETHSWAGAVLAWEEGGRYHALVGDLGLPDLDKIRTEFGFVARR